MKDIISKISESIRKEFQHFAHIEKELNQLVEEYENLMEKRRI